MFSELGFLARYTLATVKQIVVQKYRHTVQPRFQHIVVRLVDLLGGMDDEEEIFDKFLDSQSVLLLKEDETSDTIPFLNLSPFIIDENAFVDNSDVSKIYFYHHRRPDQDGWAYRWVHRPADPVLWVPGTEFGIVKEQMEAFFERTINMASPFKFLDAYTREDLDQFFGRGEETTQLYELVNQNRLVLLYGPSGTGKTSLIQCGLGNRFEATDWLPLFVRRGAHLPTSLQKALTERWDKKTGKPILAN